jgi:hypothetical protein
MNNPNAKSERPTPARDAAKKRRTFEIGEILGTRPLRRVTAEQNAPEPKPSDADSDESSDLFNRQEEEMRKVFDLPPEWRMEDLAPRKP